MVDRTIFEELVQESLDRRFLGERMAERGGRVGTDRLVDVLRHGPALEALYERPLDRGEMQEHLDVSRATSHRLVRWLEDEGFADRIEGRYHLTGEGEVVADAVLVFERNVQAADRLAPLLDVICEEHKEFVVEPFAEATVTVATPEDPFAPMNRFVSLLEATERFRGFNTTAMMPLSVEAFSRQLFEGTETEIIYLPSAVERLLEADPERARRAVSQGDLTLMTREALPYGLAVFDDRVGIGGYDEETGGLRVFVDTDAAIAREWAERTYAVYRDHADSIEALPDVPAGDD